MSYTGRSHFQPQSTLGRFGDENLESFLHDHLSQIAFEFDDVRKTYSNARNISIAIPGYNDDNIQEAIETSIQEALFPLLTDGLNSLLPKKTIVAYYGTYSEARRIRGWGVCDGTYQSGFKKPDLRHQFIRGAGDGENSGDTGGAELSNISIADLQHTENLGTATSGDTCTVCECAGGVEVSLGTHTHNVTGTINDHTFTGQITQSDNKPPYVEAIWLIKL